MKPAALLPLLVVLAACGSQAPGSVAHPSAPPAAQATPGATAHAAETLFAVLESSRAEFSPDTIAIAGLDGRARAKTHFKARSTPWVGPDLGALLAQVAHVAAGRAYYVDGDGVVRSLGVDGGVREETRFPVTSSQQEVSFAVSPDGRSLVGAVVTLPAEPNPPPTPGWSPSTPYAMDVLTAASGGAATVTYHRTWTARDGIGSGAQFVGWDPAGPVATWPSSLGTQGGGPHQWNGVSLVHFPGGRPGSALPVPGGCRPLDLLATGFVLCDGRDPSFQVLGPDGQPQWQGTVPGESLLYGFLSPDAQRAVFLADRSLVCARGATPVPLPGGFSHTGWIDAHTVAGVVEPSETFGYVDLTRPDRVVDLGFKGQFVGGVTA